MGPCLHTCCGTAVRSAALWDTAGPHRKTIARKYQLVSPVRGLFPAIGKVVQDVLSPHYRLLRWSFFPIRHRSSRSRQTPCTNEAFDGSKTKYAPTRQLTWRRQQCPLCGLSRCPDASLVRSRSSMVSRPFVHVGSGSILPSDGSRPTRLTHRRSQGRDEQGVKISTFRFLPFECSSNKASRL